MGTSFGGSKYVLFCKEKIERASQTMEDNTQSGYKIKLNMTDKVRCESRYDWTFKRSDKVSALIF